MTTIAKNISTTSTRHQTNWKEIAKFALTKFAENIYDMLMTLVSLGLVLAYCFITVPEITIQYAGYIVIFYVLLFMRRVVQDFDESYTNDEIGQSVDLILDIVKETHARMVREGTLEEQSDLDERINALR